MYELTLASVLAGLYELVGRPVIEKLRELNIPEQSWNLVVPNIRLLFLPSLCDGSNNNDWTVLLGPIHLFIYANTISTYRVSQAQPTEVTELEPAFATSVAQPDMSLPGMWGGGDPGTMGELRALWCMSKGLRVDGSVCQTVTLVFYCPFERRLGWLKKDTA
ncbi:hypothetical protein EDB87DRAFT_1361532 [Lactarius vividus]|nr:hypothetical protein EDB87DRAFT_1361532 [Lactarius vividus]